MERRILWAGDSTVQFNGIETYPQTGMGQVLGLYLQDDVRILNYAKNGRSTKSFINEGRLAMIDSELKEGDFFFIEFGHNDQKQDTQRGTDKETYKANLMQFIRTARKHKAHPVLITPLYRRYFEADGSLTSHVHQGYPEAMMEVAESEGVPCIDLTKKSMEVLSLKKDEPSKEWFMNFEAGLYENYPEGKTDNTHLRYLGAVVFSGLIAEGLDELGGIYRELRRNRMEE